VELEASTLAQYFLLFVCPILQGTPMVHQILAVFLNFLLRALCDMPEEEEYT
jgi:hypothetical protein